MDLEMQRARSTRAIRSRKATPVHEIHRPEVDLKAKYSPAVFDPKNPYNAPKPDTGRLPPPDAYPAPSAPPPTFPVFLYLPFGPLKLHIRECQSLTAGTTDASALELRRVNGHVIA
jgi:hypothetical protein